MEKSKMETHLKILTYNDLNQLGYGSRTTVWRKVRAGLFPKPRSRDGQPVWRLEDLERYFSELPEYNSSTDEVARYVRRFNG